MLILARTKFASLIITLSNYFSLYMYLILYKINAETSDLNPRVMCTSKSNKN